MHCCTQLIRSDMRPSLGVTEPGAIALAVSTARARLTGDIRHIHVSLNSGMYKNAFTCGIPGTHDNGAAYAAALGAVAGDPALGLEALAKITEADIAAAEALVRSGAVEISMAGITPEIYIRATVTTDGGEYTATIRHSHTNIVSVTPGSAVDPDITAPADSGDDTAEIHRYSFLDLYQYACTVDIGELDFLREAWDMNLALLDEGLKDPRTVILHRLYQQNGNQLLSDDTWKSAQVLCSGTIESRVLGIGRPAMSITGSGSHGIIAAMPLYAAAKCEHISEELLLRATAFSFLITQYIKEYSGKLSALCGCAIAAGTGAACGIAMMRGASTDQIISVLNQMSLGTTGMICDGGNHGCAVKSMSAVDAAFRAVDMAMNGVAIDPCHGICAPTPEMTMRNIGLIASPGMIGTEKAIVEIMDQKGAC